MALQFLQFFSPWSLCMLFTYLSLTNLLDFLFILSSSFFLSLASLNLMPGFLWQAPCWSSLSQGWYIPPNTSFQPKSLPSPLPKILTRHILLKYFYMPIKSSMMDLSLSLFFFLSNQTNILPWVSGFIVTQLLLLSHSPSILIFQASSSLSLSCTLWIPI